ncbi:MAG: hypothetical protein PHR28_02660 [candidate division Zixibacteria bacterium]|nr:hypothetical protein [candidate division Zixibacteria bacterium]
MTNRTLWLPIAAIAIMMAVALSCSKSETFTPATYKVNPDLIAAPTTFAELNLTIAPPKGWTAIDTLSLARFQLLMSNTELSTKIFPIMPLAVFSDTTTGGMMYVARVSNRTDRLASMAGQFEAFLSDQKGTSIVTPARLNVNGLNVYQYLLTSTDAANYKILGETGPETRFLIEFIVRSQTLEALLPALESSMATLKAGATP